MSLKQNLRVLVDRWPLVLEPMSLLKLLDLLHGLRPLLEVLLGHPLSVDLLIVISREGSLTWRALKITASGDLLEQLKRVPGARGLHELVALILRAQDRPRLVFWDRLHPLVQAFLACGHWKRV